MRGEGRDEGRVNGLSELRLIPLTGIASRKRQVMRSITSANRRVKRFQIATALQKFADAGS
jgi:hypothetical protein